MNSLKSNQPNFNYCVKAIRRARFKRVLKCTNLAFLAYFCLCSFHEALVRFIREKITQVCSEKQSFTSFWAYRTVWTLRTHVLANILAHLTKKVKKSIFLDFFKIWIFWAFFWIFRTFLFVGSERSEFWCYNALIELIRKEKVCSF